jgi:hypothetical protein
MPFNKPGMMKQTVSEGFRAERKGCGPHQPDEDQRGCVKKSPTGASKNTGKKFKQSREPSRL